MEANGILLETTGIMIEQPKMEELILKDEPDVQIKVEENVKVVVSRDSDSDSESDSESESESDSDSMTLATLVAAADTSRSAALGASTSQGNTRSAFHADVFTLKCEVLCVIKTKY